MLKLILYMSMCVCLYRDEEDALKLPNTSAALGCASVNMHQSNIALLSVAAPKKTPKKRFLKAQLLVWHSWSLDIKATFQINHPKNLSPDKQLNSGKGPSLQRVLQHSPHTEKP